MDHKLKTDRELCEPFHKMSAKNAFIHGFRSSLPTSTRDIANCGNQ